MSAWIERASMELLVDPRDGDIEDDASSPDRHSFLALAGTLLAEVSLPKLLATLVLLVIVPALLLGAAPLAATMWFGALAATPYLGGLWAIGVLLALAAIGWFGGRRLLAAVEGSFWSLNALAVQPGYSAFREGLLYLGQRLLPARASRRARTAVRAASAVAAGLVICALGLWIATVAWPAARWVGTLGELAAPKRLAFAALANSVVLVATYLATAGLVWGIGDAMMPQPRDLDAFQSPDDFVRRWRIAHLSDTHVVGEFYGFRLSSGRSGPRGNECFARTLMTLEAAHRERPLDAILITGDLTDAGTSAEWAELLDAFARYPDLAALVVAMPGNHDVNVVDRANPARLDLPTSRSKRLRQVRTTSAIAALQGTHMHVVNQRAHEIGPTLADALRPHAGELADFADHGSRRHSAALAAVWAASYPMVRLPDGPDGLGIIALNSNAETHFSFTNALGIVPVAQARAVDAAMDRFPDACWIVALHHHVVEYPVPVGALAKRIGTALINGGWFTRRLQRRAHRILVMHGHRHVDWIGRCGDLLIVSAPSPVMDTGDGAPAYFRIQTVGVGADGRIGLAASERIVVPGDGEARA